MGIIDLLIFSDDSDFSLAFAESLAQLKNNFIVTVCGNENELLQKQDFDLLLLDSENELACERFGGDKRVIKLTESYQDAAKDIESMTFILYKYSGIQVIAADILLYYSMLSGKKSYAWSVKSPKIILFCGAKGGVGKTTVAFGIGQALRRYYSKSVLYLSMEEIESTLLYIRGKENGFGLCEYLYYLFKKDGSRPDAEAFMIHDKYGIGAFMPDMGINRLRELNAEEVAIFLKEISDTGSYDFILIDMGETFIKDMIWLFNICHKVVAVLTPNGEADEREQRFIKYLRFILGNECCEKSVIAYNKTVDRECTFEADGRIYIDFDKDSIDDSGDMIEISIDQDFGAGIKALVKRMM